MLHIVVPFEVIVHSGHLDLVTIAVVSKETRSSKPLRIAGWSNQSNGHFRSKSKVISRIPAVCTRGSFVLSSVFHMMKKLVSNVTGYFVNSGWLVTTDLFRCVTQTEEKLRDQSRTFSLPCTVFSKLLF